MKLSVIIIAKNEEAVIADAISSASFAHEVIVIDANSTDQTRTIADKLGAKVIEKSWEGYGKQKNFGISTAAGDVLFFLDADERISPKLQKSLIYRLGNMEKDVYWITVEDVFLGKKMSHLAGHNPRFIKKGAAFWTDKHVHEQLIYNSTGSIVQYKDGISGEIQSPIIHYSHQTIASYLKKMHRYTTLDAQDMKRSSLHRSGRPIKKSPLLPYTLACRQFIKLLIYRKGILDGAQGIIWSALSAYYEYEMAKKYLAL